jgi:hypothetical protein
MVIIVGADAVQMAEGRIESPDRLGEENPPGSKSGACTLWGPPGTWEVLPSPPKEDTG